MHFHHALAHFALIVAKIFFTAITAITIRAILPFPLRLCECFLYFHCFSTFGFYKRRIVCKNQIYRRYFVVFFAICTRSNHILAFPVRFFRRVRAQFPKLKRELSRATNRSLPCSLILCGRRFACP